MGSPGVAASGVVVVVAVVVGAAESVVKWVESGTARKTEKEKETWIKLEKNFLKENYHNINKEKK